MNELKNISPIDGRYSKQTKILSEYFSEYALFKYRVRVEIEYLISLSEYVDEIPNLTEKEIQSLRDIYENFSDKDAETIKNIEEGINHDVKSVEYFVKYKLEKLERMDLVEFVHFGLTSQDINNTAIPLSLKEAQENVILPLLLEVIEKLKSVSDTWDVPMLARTHGQPASPTKMDKEIYVFIDRLKNQLELLKTIPHSGKFGGATGNFNAHYLAYDYDWVSFGNDFLNKLGLYRSQITTQIEHYDNLSANFNNWSRINTILIDMSRDMWRYISMNYFKQISNPDEVGSSAMPHKVNPIDFENAEGNLGFANGIFEFMSRKLPVSRLQRDLTDSTVLRNIGIPFSHMIVSFNSILKGLDKLVINTEKIHSDLDNHWEICAEGIQTLLRREGFEKPYESLKELTRSKEKISKDDIRHFISGLKVSDELKEELNDITPFNYTGIFHKD